MKVYDAATIRNVALVGHSGSGKTQLASAILSDAGMVNRFGKVDEGTTVTDYDEEEIARKHTLSASLAYAEWNKQKINLIDTPGLDNFLSDARAALQVADAAAVIVDAVAGVMVQTEKVWASADELALPRLVVVNRLDRERASLERALKSEAAADAPDAYRVGVELIHRQLMETLRKRGVRPVDALGADFATYSVVADAQGLQHVARLQARRRAGRPGRHRHVLHPHHQPFALDEGEAQVQVAWEAFGRMPVQGHVGQLALDPLPHLLAQPQQALRLLGHLLAA